MASFPACKAQQDFIISTESYFYLQVVEFQANSAGVFAWDKLTSKTGLFQHGLLFVNDYTTNVLV